MTCNMRNARWFIEDGRSGTSAPSRLESLDILRGVAIVGVIAAHTLAPVSSGLSRIPWALIANGRRGVQLFLVISALLTFKSLARRAEAGGTTARRYYFRRYMRLAPVYYLAILAALAGGALSRGSWPSVTPANLAAHLAFLNGLSPYWINSIMGIEWVIAVEALFFLAAPWLFRVIRSMRAAAIALAISVAASLALSPWLWSIDPIGNAGLWQDFLGISPLVQAPALMLGVFVYFAELRLRSNPRAPRARVALVVGGLAVALPAAAGWPDWPKPELVVLFAAASAAVVLGVMSVRAEGPLDRALACLGRNSYGAYLFHLFVLQAVVVSAIALTGVPDGLALRACCLPVVLLVTSITAGAIGWAIERPAVRWGGRVLADRIRGYE